MDKKRLREFKLDSKFAKLAPGQITMPREVRFAFVAVVAGAGLSFIVSAVGYANAPWAAVKGSTVIVALVSFAVTSVLFDVLPVFAVLRAVKGRRWPVIFLTLFSVFQLLMLGLSPALGVISTLLTFLGCVLLWLPNSRAYSRSMSSHRR